MELGIASYCIVGYFWSIEEAKFKFWKIKILKIAVFEELATNSYACSNHQKCLKSPS